LSKGLKSNAVSFLGRDVQLGRQVEVCFHDSDEITDAFLHVIEV